MHKKLNALLMLASLILAVACTEERETPTEGRDITYTVESKVNHAMLRSDAEWDELLDRFCTYSADGMTVTFYNANRRGQTKGKAGLSDSEAKTISTSSREELKAWMKEMEKEGKTVTITYDEKTGRWSGTAYAGGPQAHEEESSIGQYSGVLTMANLPDARGEQAAVLALHVNDDSTLVLDNGGVILMPSVLVIDDRIYDIGDYVTLQGSITNENGLLVLHLAMMETSDMVGKWHYYSMTTLFHSTDEGFINSYMTTYTPESMGISIFYELREDGTMTFTRTNLYGDASTTAEGTWSMTPYGDVTCDFFDGGSQWKIDLLMNGLMVLSREAYGTEEGDFYYQMELHQVE